MFYDKSVDKKYYYNSTLMIIVRLESPNVDDFCFVLDCPKQYFTSISKTSLNNEFLFCIFLYFNIIFVTFNHF